MSDERDLDARLAEAMGIPMCRDVKCDGEKCAAEVSGVYLTDVGGLIDGAMWQGLESYSSDVAAAVSAAEEMRKAGRIGSWSVAASSAGKFGAYILNGDRGDFAEEGSSAAHALTLALVAALESR